MAFPLEVCFIFNDETEAKENAMDDTNTLSSANSKSILSNLKSAKGLPFQDVLSKKSITNGIQGLNYRDRFFTPDVVLWAFLSQVLDDDHSQQAAVARVIAFFTMQGLDSPSANTSAYSQARSNLPEEVISNLARGSAEEMKREIPSHLLWKDKYHPKLMDGSTISMPDTQENQECYPQPDSQKSGIGFPIARIVTVTSHITGMVLDLAIGPYSGKKTGEHALLRKLMPVFEPDDIAMGDCYYASYFLLAQLIKSNINAVFPIHNARNHDFRTGELLGEKDHIVRWKKPAKPEWMDQETYDQVQDKITVREVEIKNERKGYRTKTRILVTTFLDPVSVSKEDLAMLYDYRWCIELDLRSLKQTMHMDILRGKTPMMVRKEIWAHLLAYNLIRKVMCQAAVIHNKNPRHLSFKLALQMIEAFRDAGIFCEKNSNAYALLLKAIAHKKVGNRAGRREPRMVKRRPKPFPRLQKARQFYKKVA
jgi:Transposase DDE domain